jgi:3-oxoacyl-[acyl-carrier-protein] synthase III
MRAERGTEKLAIVVMASVLMNGADWSTAAGLIFGDGCA